MDDPQGRQSGIRRGGRFHVREDIQGLAGADGEGRCGRGGRMREGGDGRGGRGDGAIVEGGGERREREGARGEIE